MVFPFTANKSYKTAYPGIKMSFALSHTISHRVSFGYNLGIEWDGDITIPAYFYSGSLGISISKKSEFL
jgi:hypothetical protein